MGCVLNDDIPNCSRKSSLESTPASECLVRDLEGPAVRLEGDDTIMAPMVIHAFYLLFTMIQGIELELSESLKQEMLQLLSENKFSLEFSMEIVDFFTKKGDGQ